jgi:hypothetical protein
MSQIVRIKFHRSHYIYKHLSFVAAAFLASLPAYWIAYSRQPVAEDDEFVVVEEPGDSVTYLDGSDAYLQDIVRRYRRRYCIVHSRPRSQVVDTEVLADVSQQPPVARPSGQQDLELLQAQIDALNAQLSDIQLKPGPEGPPGMNGRDGKDGSSPSSESVAAAIDLQAVADLVPKPQNGKDGVDGRPGTAGAPGRDAPPLEDIVAAVVDVVGISQGAAGPPGPSGDVTIVVEAGDGDAMQLPMVYVTSKQFCDGCDVVTEKVEAARDAGYDIAIVQIDGALRGLLPSQTFTGRLRGVPSIYDFADGRTYVGVAECEELLTTLEQE